MGEIEDRYISLLTDFGFKRIFGSEPNSDLLISFLNSLLTEHAPIVSIKYLNGEKLGDIDAERKAIFDVYCETEAGERFVVEMQNSYQKFFKDRSIFYSTFPIREQAKKGAEWDFRLDHVYTVALLNFSLHEPSFDPKSINHTVVLKDNDTNRIFYDKLDFIYVEITKFNKTEDELETIFDKWLYVLKNLSRLSKRPASLRERIFDRLFEVAEIAKFSPSDIRAYEDSMNAYRDIKNSIDTAKEEGFEKGHAEGMEEGIKLGEERGIEMGIGLGEERGRKKAVIAMAQTMKADGFPTEAIAKYTGLTVEEIGKL